MPKKLPNDEKIYRKASKGRLTKKEIISMDWGQINALSEKQLREVVKRASHLANRYVQRAEKGGYSSPGLQTGLARKERLGRDFTSERLSLNQLRSELKDLVSFLDNTTLTKKASENWFKNVKKVLEGNNLSKETKNDIQERIGYTTNAKMQPGDMKKFWELYGKFKETDSFKMTNFGSKYSDVQINFVYEVFKKHSFDVDSALEEMMKEDWSWLQMEDIENPFDLVN